MTNSSGKLRLNFRFEWGGPAWLRGADRAARDEVGAGPCQTRVGLSAETLARGNALT